MNKKPTIGVIGCGWLGLPLAEVLLINNYAVKGSTTSAERIEILRNKGIDPYLVHFPDANPKALEKLLDCDVLVINIPPRGKTQEGAASYKRMADLITGNVVEHRVQKIILVSSTSVYPDTNAKVTESSSPKPQAPTARLLLEVENQFLALSNKQVCVLRPAGLIGPERHPGNFFRNKSGIVNGLAPVNLIHRDDVIGILLSLIRNPEVSGIYNAVSLTHPSKHEFYAKAAKVLDNPAPEFILEEKSYKIIASERVKEELNYSFKYPNLTSWLEEQAGFS